MQQQITQTVSMLFSDLKGYSKVKDDNLKARLEMVFKPEIEQLIQSYKSCFYFNTWGDAFFICSYSPTELAELALELLHKVKTKNWKKLGFSEDIQIRIALHIQEAEVIKKRGKVTNVVGVGVDTTARIEPETEPDKVFCSDLFFQHLGHKKDHKVKGKLLGVRTLAKQYGKMKLYELMWQHESSTLTKQPEKATTTAKADKSVPMPKVRGEFTDKQKTDFLHASFAKVQRYFTQALKKLEASRGDIETSLRKVTEWKFVCELYQNGKSKNQCKLWIGSHSFIRDGICYFSGRHVEVDSDNAHHELIQVNNDDVQLYLKMTGMGFMMYPSNFDSNSKLTPEQAAEILWFRFIKPLE